MSALEAAHTILEKAGEPLSYGEITRRALEQGLWSTSGKTPDATVHAQLAVDIKKKGSESRFQRTAPGTFALRKWGLPEAKAKKATRKKKKADSPDKGETDEAPQQAAPEPVLKKTMSFTDAAEHVLENSGSRRPMHYRAITEKALEERLVVTSGRTPEATLYAQIITEIDRRSKRGDTQRFVRHGKGMFGLRKWRRDGLAYQIERHNADVRKKLLETLQSMDPTDFEALMGELLVKIGFEEVVVTKATSDGGIDVRGTLVVGDVVRTRMAVQVKRWKNNIRSPIVQQVRGSLGTHEQGLIITTSGFSKGARDEAERPDAIPVGLMDGEQLVKLMVEHGLGVKRSAYDLIELEVAREGEAE